MKLQLHAQLIGDPAWPPWVLEHGATYSVGRLPGENDIVLPHDTVSKRQHAKLVVLKSDRVRLEVPPSQKNRLIRGDLSFTTLELAPGDPPVCLGEVVLSLKRVANKDTKLSIRFEIGEPTPRASAEHAPTQSPRHESAREDLAIFFPMLTFPEGFVPGRSPVFGDALEKLEVGITSQSNILLLGESGVGKELFAQIAHRSGRHSSGPWVAINCAAIPSELLEAELFGIEKRVATHVDPRPGRFLQANGGTLFLDEVGDLPLELQAKLLRVVDTRKVEALGARHAVPLDFSLVCATNKDLEREVDEERFRLDLFYRIREQTVTIPPLRERPEDLKDLLSSLLFSFCKKLDRPIRGVTEGALELLQSLPWPGNIRQLESELRVALAKCSPRDSLRTEHFSELVERSEPRKPGSEAAPTAPKTTDEDLPTLAEVQREVVGRAFRKHGGNKAQTAQALGITKFVLNGLLRKLEINLED